MELQGPMPVSKRICCAFAALAVFMVAAMPSLAGAQEADFQGAPLQEQAETVPVEQEAPPPPREPTPAVSAYQINSGDALEIYVWGEERLQRVLRVLPDGTIAFPLVGQMKVAGLLPQDVERMVSERLRDQYRGEVPFVTVSVSEPAGMQFSVMGKVRSPGTFTAARYINVLDALSLAGGPAEFANLDNVLIITRRNEQLVTTQARLGSLFRPGANAADIQRANIIQLLPGDVIIVP